MYPKKTVKRLSMIQQNLAQPVVPKSTLNTDHFCTFSTIILFKRHENIR